MILNTLSVALLKTLSTLNVYWPFLAIGVIIATAARNSVDQKRITSLIRHHSRIAIPVAVAFAVLTPFCSCGTMAVIISMIASTSPWGPIVAFMVASPLMSPSTYAYATGLMGWGFANALLLASAMIGLGAGYVAEFLDRKGWLVNQARLSGGRHEPCLCGAGSNERPKAMASGRPQLGPALVSSGIRILGLYFLFSFIGHVVIEITPQQAVLTLFGSSRTYAVPFAASIGLPLYITGEASLPLVRSLVQGGMSTGSALAFTIAGAGTSLGAVAGAFVIARSRVVGLVVGAMWAGAVLAGHLYNLLL